MTTTIPLFFLLFFTALFVWIWFATARAGRTEPRAEPEKNAPVVLDEDESTYDPMNPRSLDWFSVNRYSSDFDDPFKW